MRCMQASSKLTMISMLLPPPFSTECRTCTEEHQKGKLLPCLQFRRVALPSRRRPQICPPIYIYTHTHTHTHGGPKSAHLMIQRLYEDMHENAVGKRVCVMPKHARIMMIFYFVNNQNILQNLERICIHCTCARHSVGAVFANHHAGIQGTGIKHQAT